METQRPQRRARTTPPLQRSEDRDLAHPGRRLGHAAGAGTACAVVLYGSGGGHDTNGMTWPGYLQPGTYLIESGTHPSIQGPMGLYGMLVVTTAPVGDYGGYSLSGSGIAAGRDLQR